MIKRKFLRTKMICLLICILGAVGYVAYAAGEKPGSNWIRKIALGMERKKGNTDKFSLNFDINLERTNSTHTIILEAKESYGEEKGAKTTENGKILAEYQRFLNERWYIPASLAPEYDDIADVKYRVITSVGIGYYFLKKDTIRLSGDMGPSVVNEEVGGETDNYIGARVTARMRISFMNKSEIWLRGRYIPRFDDMGNYLMNGEIGIEAPLGSWLGLRFVVTDDYNSRPAEGKESNDLTMNTAVSINF